MDNDCSGVIPLWDRDQDGDGWSECGGDCDDGEPTIHPGAAEVCNGLDDDCSGIVPPWEVDIDGDGWSECGGDCDDLDAGLHPFTMEICNAVDDDCDGQVDEWGVCDGAVMDEASCQALGGSFFTANGHCYIPHAGQGPWHSALAACEADGGYLVTIADATEEQFVQSVFPHRFWLGFTDASGSWEWITGEPVTYTHWSPNEPNDWLEPEDCGESAAMGPWNDLWCDDPYGWNEGYVCEIGS